MHSRARTPGSGPGVLDRKKLAADLKKWIVQGQDERFIREVRNEFGQASNLRVRCPTADDDILRLLRDLSAYKPTLRREKTLKRIQLKQLDILLPLVNAYEEAMARNDEPLESQLMGAMR